MMGGEGFVARGNDQADAQMRAIESYPDGPRPAQLTQHRAQEAQ